MFSSAVVIYVQSLSSSLNKSDFKWPIHQGKKSVKASRIGLKSLEYDHAKYKILLTQPAIMWILLVGEWIQIQNETLLFWGGKEKVQKIFAFIDSFKLPTPFHALKGKTLGIDIAQLGGLLLVKRARKPLKAFENTVSERFTPADLYRLAQFRETVLERLIMQLNPYFENRRTPKFQLRSKHITEAELLYLYLCEHMLLPFQ